MLREKEKEWKPEVEGRLQTLQGAAATGERWKRLRKGGFYIVYTETVKYHKIFTKAFLLLLEEINKLHFYTILSPLGFSDSGSSSEMSKQNIRFRRFFNKDFFLFWLFNTNKKEGSRRVITIPLMRPNGDHV